MKDKPIEAVFFDVGGTLLYIHPSVEAVYTSVSREMGIQVEEQQIKTMMGELWDEYAPVHTVKDNLRASDEKDRQKWKRFLKQLHKEIPELQKISFEAWFEQIYQRFGSSRTFETYEETEEVLQTLREQGYQLGIVSNWDSRLIDICREKGITDHMEFVLPSAVAGYRKPSQKIFDRALEQMDISPMKIVHVGDRYDEDCVGAKNAGLHTLLIDRNQDPQQETNHNPEDVTTITDLRSMYNLLDISETD